MNRELEQFFQNDFACQESFVNPLRRKVAEMKKRNLKRTPSPRMTPELAAKIKRMRQEGLYTHQIAAELRINQGRVSEVITGKRFKDDPPSGQSSLDL